MTPAEAHRVRMVQHTIDLRLKKIASLKRSIKMLEKYAASGSVAILPRYDAESGCLNPACNAFPECRCREVMS